MLQTEPYIKRHEPERAGRAGADRRQGPAERERGEAGADRAAGGSGPTFRGRLIFDEALDAPVAGTVERLSRRGKLKRCAGAGHFDIRQWY